MKIKNIKVTLDGAADIMFDRFVDHSKEPRPPEQKLYLIEGNVVVLPAINILSFLFNQKVPSCANMFEGKKRRDYILTGQSHISITPQHIPFLRKGKPIAFNGFDEDTFYAFNSSPTTKLQGGGVIKQEARPRPVLKLPWQLEFQIMLFENNLIDENKLRNWFDSGGILIAFGTYRPTFGRFFVSKWEVKK